MSYQKENGNDLTNWTVDELSQCIRDYYVYVDPNYGQYDQQQSDQMSDQQFHASHEQNQQVQQEHQPQRHLSTDQ